MTVRNFGNSTDLVLFLRSKGIMPRSTALFFIYFMLCLVFYVSMPIMYLCTFLVKVPYDTYGIVLENYRLSTEVDSSCTGGLWRHCTIEDAFVGPPMEDPLTIDDCYNHKLYTMFLSLSSSSSCCADRSASFTRFISSSSK